MILNMLRIAALSALVSFAGCTVSPQFDFPGMSASARASTESGATSTADVPGDGAADLAESNATISPATANVVTSASSIIAGVNGSFNGFRPRILDDLYTDISAAPVDAFTPSFLSVFGAAHLQADFTIPYTVVSRPVMTGLAKLSTADESDVMPVPLGPTVAIENGAIGCTEDGKDHHAIVIDNTTGWDYEIYQAAYCNGKWSAYSVTAWDMLNTQQRPYGWTSADAAGLPLLPLLVRYDEVASGHIDHALRVTMNHTRTGPNGSLFVAPATHGAGDVWGIAAITGMKMRLKPGFDISSYSATNQTILKALKKYGMIVADNGSSGFFQGTADARWNGDDLNVLRRIKLNNFDIVQMGKQQATNAAPTGSAPKIKSLSAVKVGNNTVMNWLVSGGSYLYVQEIGPVRGTGTMMPYASGAKYTLVATNQFGRTTKTVTVR